MEEKTETINKLNKDHERIIKNKRNIYEKIEIIILH